MAFRSHFKRNIVGEGEGAGPGAPTALPIGGDRFSRRTRELLTTGDAVLADGRHLLALLRADLRDAVTREMPVIADEEAVAELRSRRAR